MTARGAVLDAIEEVTGERPTDAVPLAELVDSLGAVALVMAIEDDLGLDPDDRAFALATVGDLMAHFEGRVRG